MVREKSKYGKGRNPNSLANLRKRKKFTSETGSAAGIKSNAIQAENRSTRAILEAIGALEFNDVTLPDGRVVRVDMKTAMLLNLVNSAIRGNVRASQVILKALGEEGSTNVELNMDGKISVLTDDILMG